MPISLLGGKYRVNLQTRGGIRYTVAVKNGCIVGGTIEFPNGTKQKVTGPYMIKIIKRIILDNKNLSGDYSHLVGSKKGPYLIPARYGSANFGNNETLDPDNKVDAGSLETIMDDYYGGTMPNIFESVTPTDLLQALENAVNRNCVTNVNPYTGQFETYGTSPSGYRET